MQVWQTHFRHNMMRIAAAVALVAFLAGNVHCQRPGLGSMMPGMGGMGAMPGIGGMGGIGPMGLALGGELSPRDFIMLDNAVKSILGPDSSPSPALIILAAQQGGMPSSATGMLPYMALMQAMAREKNITVPGVVGQPNNAQIDNYIMEKTMEWVQQRTMYGTMTENPEIIMSMQQGQSNPLAASLGPALGAGMGTGMEASNPLASMLGGSSAALLSLPSAAAAPGSSSSPSSMPGLLAALAASRGSSSMNPMIASLMMNNMAGSSGSGSSNTGGATSNPLMGLLSMGAIGMDLPMM